MSNKRENVMSRPELPWALPFRDWHDKELQKGLAACEEFGWKNNRKHIEAEQKIRSLKG